jgi:hypothetical protein
MIASNNQWIVPVGIKGRRYCVLDASNKFADEKGPQHKAYWDPLGAQFAVDTPDDSRRAMLYDLLHMDLRGFNARDQRRELFCPQYMPSTYTIRILLYVITS